MEKVFADEGTFKAYNAGEQTSVAHLSVVGLLLGLPCM